LNILRIKINKKAVYRFAVADENHRPDSERANKALERIVKVCN